MATDVLVNGATEILKKLGTVIAREISLAWGVKDDLAKLRQTLEMILAVMSDADKRQINDIAVRLWLRRLKDVAYDADDILDDFSNDQYMRREMHSLKHKSFFITNKYLRVLNLSGSLGKVIPTSIAKLNHLRYLDLSYSNVDSVLHHQIISSLYNLQTMVLHHCKQVLKLLENIGSLKNLRHLDLSQIDELEILPDSITNLYNLRTLDLSYNFGLEALPTNVGALKHLRCLDISSIGISELPDSITKLYNLRMLKLSILQELPRDIGELKHLRCLDLSCTEIKELPESCTKLNNLEMVNLGRECKLPKDIRNWTKLRSFVHRRELHDEMPRGIGRLTCLETLCSYLVRNKDVMEPNCLGIEELEGLNLLRELVIRNLEHVRDQIDAKRANLKGKQNIHRLNLYWSINFNEEEEEEDELNEQQSVVLEALQPHPNLKVFTIDRFMGSKLPTWMGVSSSNCLSNLVELHVIKCCRCDQLPALGQLPCLRYLAISGMDDLKYLGNELYGIGGGESSVVGEKEAAAAAATSFPSLIELSISEMKNLEEWVAPPPTAAAAVTSFPCLETIEIYSCPKLRITPTLFPSLKELRVDASNYNAISSIVRDLTSLTSLHLDKLPELIFVDSRGVHQNNNLLQDLEIYGCRNFQGFRVDGDKFEDKNDDDEALSTSLHLNISSLRSLVIRGCPALTLLPDIPGLTSLRGLTIQNCGECLKSLPYNDLYVDGK
ncbi:Leucine-rich repeat [Macleaya cordata]|uniref:Leucine-rich repeat n=1 Tax=Macleaya cordata TaxID=56857 RepID=A0A200PXX0_MACCD|nr:Leucine-rich repeat [Macleaya cordata]